MKVWPQSLLSNICQSQTLCCFDLPILRCCQRLIIKTQKLNNLMQLKGNICIFTIQTNFSIRTVTERVKNAGEQVLPMAVVTSDSAWKNVLYGNCNCSGSQQRAAFIGRPNHRLLLRTVQTPPQFTELAKTICRHEKKNMKEGPTVCAAPIISISKCHRVLLQEKSNIFHMVDFQNI